jgi:general secretion pathway protein A
MYKTFYGFSEEPFTLNPNRKFLFLSKNHKEVLDSLVCGIAEGKEFLLLTGEAGTGKTTLIHELISMLPPKVEAVPIYQPCKSFDELLEVILQDLKLPLEERSRSFMLSQFNRYLFRMSADHGTLLIILDEAQDLNNEVLEELRLLCNSDPRRPRLLQEFFVGQPKLLDKLNSTDLRQLQQRIVIRCQLRSLSKKESGQYLDHRLTRVGSCGLDIFTPDATDLIYRHSKGVPRVINMLCYIGLSAGYALSKKKLDAAVIQEVCSLLDSQKERWWQRIEISIGKFINHFEKSPWITKLSYALFAYAFLEYIVVLLLYCYY